MITKDEIFPIGIGTWKVDYENFTNDLENLKYSLNKGQNYLPLYMLYNDGQVVKQMRTLIDQVDRQKLFIGANLEPTINSSADIEKQLDSYLKVLGLKYVDVLSLHHPFYTNIPLIDVYKEIERLVKIGKVRYIGISNVNLEMLKEINGEVKIDFFEGVYNLECKIYEDIKVLDYCKEHQIKFMCYQPLRRNRTAKRHYEILEKLASKYRKTSNQILINWIIYEKGICPIIKCTNKERIDENISALDFKMIKEDYEALNAFRSAEFDNISINWYSKTGVSIDQLANQFE